MTRRRQLEQHRHSLTEIGDIMNSMKTLAYMEVQKLIRFLDAQKTVVTSIEDVAADFLSYYPEALPEAKASLSAMIVIGSQRGFCGDFNHVLLKQLQSSALEDSVSETRLIVIGRRMHTLLEGDGRVAARLDGPGIAEEVTPVLIGVVEELAGLQRQFELLNVRAMHHESEDRVVIQELLPPFRHFRGQPPQYTHPPLLNQSPEEFLVDLSDQYLFAALHEMLYTSLMAENHRRLTHLEGAVRRLEDQSADLEKKCNALRQEEIIEEIEVILLNAGGPEQVRLQADANRGACP